MEYLRTLYRKVRSYLRKDFLFERWSNRKIDLPKNETFDSVFQFLASYAFDDGSPAEEMRNYLKQDFKRFLITLNLLPPPLPGGNLLDIGANPYYFSMLVRKFTSYKLHMTNFFGDNFPYEITQTKTNPKNGETVIFNSFNCNIEKDELGFEKEFFDVVCFCEVIEHLNYDPMGALLRIKEHLKPGGHLILTTPNVARLENVVKLILGANIYDPYSGYGIYGRHNREYNKHELFLLLSHLGFEIEEFFSANVHADPSREIFRVSKIVKLIHFRKYDLGQYIFIRAKNIKEPNLKKPNWLYRSYPLNDLC